MDNLIRLKHANRKITEILTEAVYNQPEKFTMNWSADTKIVEVQSPASVSMKALGSDLRHFIAQDSNLNFKKLVDALKHNQGSDGIEELRSLNKQWNAVINGTGKGTGLVLMLNGEEIGPRELLDLMHNGEFFHVDDEKAHKLALMRGSPVLGAAHLNYILILHRLVDILNFLQLKYIAPHLAEIDRKDGLHDKA